MQKKFIYTMPESFLKDESVPARWRVLGIINGFILNDGCFFGSNEWLMEQLGCSEQTVSNAFKELEDLNEVRIERTRRTRKVYKISRDPSQLGSETQVGSFRDPSWFGTNSVSNSEKNTYASEDAPRVVEVSSLKSKKVRSDAHIIETFVAIGGEKYPKYWEVRVPYRDAADRLWNEKGIEQIRKAIQFIRENKNEKYLPKANNPLALEEKWDRILDFKENL